MDLLSYAVPGFLLLILIELGWDLRTGGGRYRLADAISSMSAGALSTTFDVFTKVLSVAVYTWVLDHFALVRLDPAWFDFSVRGIALWAVVLLAWDFFYYWTHRLGHEVSVFWAAHAVHHQSEDYNLSTALRQTSTGFVISWIVYLPMFVAGVPVHVFATVAALDLIYQFWVHTQYIDKLGWADRVFVTPSNHRVHHAQNARYIDRNYGGILIVWDRLFGTFQPELDDDPVVYGVRKPLATWNPFAANLQVYRELWRDARRARRWQDKLAIWWRRTGWRPADVAERFPAPVRSLDAFHKYDTRMARGLRWYVLTQFVIAAMFTTVVGLAAATIAPSQVLLLCLPLWLLLFTIGSLSDGRRGAVAWEFARLVVLTPCAIAALLAFVPAAAEWRGVLIAPALVYLAATTAWLAALYVRGSTVVAHPELAGT